MPTFKVRRRVDAYVDYVAEVEADDARGAAETARDQELQLSWQCEGECEFDTRVFLTLDSDGNEIEGAEVRDL